MPHVISLPNASYLLSGDRLHVLSGDDMVLDVCLSPAFNGTVVPITGWEPAGERLFSASLGAYGRAFIGAQFERLAYWIETPVRQFDHVVYLSDGLISGDVWRTFVSDDYERLWDKKIDAHIPISSAYAESNSPDGVDGVGGGMTDPADVPVHWVWNVQTRAFAVKGRARWLGLSIPGPWGIGVTRLTMRKTRLGVGFEFLQTGCTGGKMPVVYFCPGLADGFDALDEHRLLSEKLGLMDLAPKTVPEWWKNPWFGYYDEFERQLHGKVISRQSSNVMLLLKGWLERTQELCAHREFNVNLEQGCYRLYGDYRPAPIMGTAEEVRAVTDAWRAEGVHVGHYIHPFVVNTKVPFYREHPEAFCRPKDPTFLMAYPLETWDADNPQFAPLDWTHPLGREFLLQQVDYLLSAAPGCRNCDILRSNNWRSPDPRVYDFHDPDWGVGDLMTFKVQKLLYERSKAIKPEAMVTKVAVSDCYMQPTCDAVQVAEDWTHSMEHWYRRYQVVTRTLRNTMLWLDPWFVTRTKGDEYYMSLLALSLPETQSVEHAPHCYYPAWRPLGEKHLRRRKAGFHVYLNSPVDPADECRVTWDPQRLEIYRRKTTGPLAGWFGALALSPKCVVSYSATEARVAASETRLDWVPLPPGARLQAVTRVFHQGGEAPYEYESDAAGQRIRLYIEDCGAAVFYYRIGYELDARP
jgi:hypothetical protein